MKSSGQSLFWNFARACALSALLALAACSTPSTKPVTEEKSKSSSAPTTGGPAQPATVGTVPSSKPAFVEDGPPLPFGEYHLRVESVPDGATVVVNGIPVGHAPQLIRLPGTQRGYFRDQVSIKVRFLAQDSNHASQTVEELLTPLDRIPYAVKFTPSGATRVAR